MMSDKIKPHHLERKAVLYVRQSSTHKVIHNRDGRSLQYAVRERLAVLGWPEIEIIDDESWYLGRWQRDAGWVRAHGRRSLPRQGWRSGGT